MWHLNRSHKPTKEKTTHSGGFFFCRLRGRDFELPPRPPAAAMRRRREWVSAAKRTQCVLFASVSRKQGARQGALAAPKPHDYVFGRAMKNPTPSAHPLPLSLRDIPLSVPEGDKSCSLCDRNRCRSLNPRSRHGFWGFFMPFPRCKINRCQSHFSP